MALSAEYREYLEDLFAGVGPIRIKRMFGGAGVYLDDACFAIVLGGEEILMRGDANLGPKFEAEGSTQWVYESDRRGEVAMPYWRLPDSAQDDPEEAAIWARLSLEPAREAAAKKAAAKARKAAKKAKEERA